MAKSVLMYENPSLTNRECQTLAFQVRRDIDRQQLPGWMNASFRRMPFDWDLLRKHGNEWLRYWDTEIRGRGK